MTWLENSSIVKPCHVSCINLNSAFYFRVYPSKYFIVCEGGPVKIV